MDLATTILWGERRSFDSERTCDVTNATAATEYTAMETRIEEAALNPRHSFEIGF